MTRARNSGSLSVRLSVEGMEDRLAPAAGGLDPSFGANGIVTLTYPPNAAITTPTLSVTGSAVQSDGKILLVGTTGPNTQGANAYVSGSPSPDFAVVRLNPSGSVDTTFGVNGRVTIPFDIGSQDQADLGATIGIQSNGKIIVGGSTFTGAGIPPANNYQWAVARLNTDGSLDTTFGQAGTGKVTFGFNGAVGEGVSGMAIMPDDRIVLTGTGNAATPNQFDMVRLEPTGQFDTTFGGTGRVFFFDNNGTLNAPLSGSVKVALEPDSSFIVGGALPGFGGDILINHILVDGAVDSSFGGGKEALAKLPVLNKTTGLINGVLGDIKIQSDGKILIAGGQLGGGNFDVVRFTATGLLDSTFGKAGLVQIPFALGGTNTDIAEGISIQPDGKIVVGGKAQTSGGNPTIPTINATYTFAAARLTSAGKLDTTFGSNGSQTYTVPTVNGVGNLTGANSSIFVSGGKILMAGNDGSRLVALQLLNDTTFNPLPPPPAPPVTPVVQNPGTTTSLLALSGAGPLTIAYPTTAAGQYNTSQLANLGVFGTYQALTQGFTGVVRTAVADVNGDGVPDYVLVTGPGIPTRFAVLNGSNPNQFLVAPTAPFRGSEDFTGGGFVSVGNIEGTGRADIVITPDQGGGPRVVVFDDTPTGLAVRVDFLGIADPNFRGGARTAVGDVNGDGVPDLAVAAGAGGGSRIALFDGTTVLTTSQTKLVGDFFAFNNTLRDGAYVAIGDMNGDGYGDLIFGAGNGGAPQVLVISGQQLISGVTKAFTTPLSSFFVAGDTTDRGGARVAVKNVDGDNKADLVVSTGGGGTNRVRVYLGANFSGRGEPKTFQDLTPFSTTLADGIYVG